RGHGGGAARRRARGHPPPPPAAGSRRVPVRLCAAWRAVVDAHRLLRADLLPLSLGGIFINFNNYYISELFSCPSTAGRPSVSGKHDYLPEPTSRSWSEVHDHCNGLVLVNGFDDDGICWYVLNPATRWVARLPPLPPPPMEMDTYQDMYLVYDPAVSPDYDVVSVSHLLYKELPGYPDYDSSIDDRDPAVEQSEWPPLVCTLHAFSSRTGQWEERSFAREGGSAGTVADMRDDLREQRNAMEWVLKNDRDLRKCLLKHKLGYSRRPGCGYGRADTNCYYDEYDKDDNMEAPVEEEFEFSSQVSEDEESAWNSDDGYHGCMDILGFHPFEEIIFLSESITRGLAYHFNSSKVEVLGNIYPAAYGKELGNEQLIMSSFPYTPCWL
uniref:F-box associated domain-containing protein n=1 Tax=Setaria italica TaxID=4555 RepID=K4AIJ7_SETIT